MMLRIPIYLASQSPRRSELLACAGISFEAVSSTYEERPNDEAETPDVYVMRQAEGKAFAANIPDGECLLVVGADTIVSAGGEVLGKPKDEADAARMLRILSGTSHEVLTGVSFRTVRDGASDRVDTICVRTRVFFRRLSDDEIAAYVVTGEPLDKAGAYAIQGRAAAFVERIEGSYTNVVGLPLAEVYEYLERYAKSTE